MQVTVLDREAQNRAWGNGGGGLVLVTVEIAETCPICGGPRGVPVLRSYCEDGVFYSVHNWENPCGHIDKYADVLTEAREVANECIPRTHTGAGIFAPWCTMRSDGHVYPVPPDDEDLEALIMKRVGKSHAGRFLDGQLHDGYPEVKP